MVLAGTNAVTSIVTRLLTGIMFVFLSGLVVIGCLIAGSIIPIAIANEASKEVRDPKETTSTNITALHNHTLHDLGVVGTVFPIKERNIITAMQEKLRSPLGQKLLYDFEAQLKRTRDAQSYVPTPNAALTPTPEYRSYLFNPSISLNQDLSDHNGTRFYQAGTKVNPLDHLTLSKDYLFIDGDRPAQVAWAHQYQKDKPTLIILVKGDPMRIMRDQKAKGLLEHSTDHPVGHFADHPVDHPVNHPVNHPIFFDQEGAMATRFQLTHVPCSMIQDGKNLRITEWVEEELKDQLLGKHPFQCPAEDAKKGEGTPQMGTLQIGTSKAETKHIPTKGDAK